MSEIVFLSGKDIELALSLADGLSKSGLTMNESNLGSSHSGHENHLALPPATKQSPAKVR